MVALPDNFRYDSTFLPPDSDPVLTQQQPQDVPDDLLQVSPCNTNISTDVVFNFSTNVVCSIIAEAQQVRVLPSMTEVVLIVVYVVLIASGVVSNLLVCFVVIRQCSRKKLDLGTSSGPRSRNLYIVNLAVADLALCCICMPFTLVKLVRQGWTLGSLLCKLVPVLQGTNITVSSGTITAIALDRYFTIVRSTRRRSGTTTTCTNVTVTITFIWLLSFLVTLPVFFYTHVEPVSFGGFVLYEECLEQWPSPLWKCVFTILLTVIQFGIPVLALTIIHLKISAYLHLHLKPVKKPKIKVHSPVEGQNNNEDVEAFPDKEGTVEGSNRELLNITRKESVCSENSQRSYESSRKNSDCSDSKSPRGGSPRKKSDFLTSFRETSEFSGFSFSKLSSERSKTKTQKRARRELRRNRRTMLILSCIAVVYACSWLPMNVFQVLDVLQPNYFTSPNTLYLAFTCCHVLAMTTAITNPLLYGWLNTNFRREFSLIFSSLSSMFSKIFKRQLNGSRSLLSPNVEHKNKGLLQDQRRASLTVVTNKHNTKVVTKLHATNLTLDV